MEKFQIFLVAVPGLEDPLRAEALEAGFHNPRIVPGGVIFDGLWSHVWRANLVLRGAVRVLARVAVFKAHHLSQLGPEVARIDWAALLAPGTAMRVEASCRKSRINHAGAVSERVGAAIACATGAEVSEDEAALRIFARLDKDHVTLSIDTSGAPLHRRGHKQAVAKAPLRETIAAMFLRQMGCDGRQSVFDPMCGSGTIPIEAAEIALGLLPGRSRRFAYEALRSFDAEACAALKEVAPHETEARCVGSDRDAGAITSAQANAARAGVDGITTFARKAVSAAAPPEGPPGIVLTNPPYGARIGNRRDLFALYGALGKTLATRFQGWRVGIVTSDGGLARSTALDLHAGDPVSLGGLTVRLYQTRI